MALFDVWLCGSLCVAGMPFDVCWLELTVRDWVAWGKGCWCCMELHWGEVLVLMIYLELYESWDGFFLFFIEVSAVGIIAWGFFLLVNVV
jgi:hypothetical protein